MSKRVEADWIRWIRSDVICHKPTRAADKTHTMVSWMEPGDKLPRYLYSCDKHWKSNLNK